MADQMGDCLFCSIAAGDIPSAKVYDDDRVFAFLDINPLRRGHTLVVPKAHAERLEQADPEDAGALLKAAQKLGKTLADLTGDPDATLAINNGPGAGQEVGHVHLHIVPRASDDGVGPVHALFSERPDVPENDLKVLAAQIRDALGVADA